MKTVVDRLARKDHRLRLAYVLETPADIRFLRQFTVRYDLTVITRSALRDGYCTWQETLSPLPRVWTVDGSRAAFPLGVMQQLIAHRREYDVVLVLDITLGALGANFARPFTGKPVVVQEGRLPDEYYACKHARGQVSLAKHLLGYVGLKALIAFNVRCSNYTVSISSYDMATLSHYTRNIIWVPWYGVNTNLFSPVSASERGLIRQRLGLPKDKFLVLFPSRISPEKDPETVLTAAAELNHQHGDVCIVHLSGQYQEFERLARDYKVECIARPAVHPIEALPAYYQSADVFVQASIAEGLCLSHLESLACGLPTIVTAVGGMKDVIQNDNFGISIPPRDASALVQALAYVRKHPDEMRTRALAGRQQVVSEYEEQRTFERLDVLLESLVQNSHL